MEVGNIFRFLTVSMRSSDGHSHNLSKGGARPELPVGVPEEGDLKVNMSDVVVWFDPLDATQEQC